MDFLLNTTNTPSPDIWKIPRTTMILTLTPNYLKSSSLDQIKFFILTAKNKKFDHIIYHSLRNTKAYEPFFNKITSALTHLIFSHQREMIFTARLKLCLRQIKPSRTHIINSYKDTIYTVHHPVIHTIALFSLTQSKHHPTSLHTASNLLTCTASSVVTTLSDRFISFVH